MIPDPEFQSLALHWQAASGRIATAAAVARLRAGAVYSSGGAQATTRASERSRLGSLALAGPGPESTGTQAEAGRARALALARSSSAGAGPNLNLKSHRPPALRVDSDSDALATPLGSE
eukprot:3646843-Rhodomonas_salina.1